MGLKYKESSFIDAAASGNTIAVSLFLRAGMPPNKTDSIGRTALWEAQKGNHSETVILLIGAGANYSLSLPEIIKEIYNPTQEIRQKAFEAIKSIGPQAKDATSSLITFMKSDAASNYDVFEIISALKAIGTPEALQASNDFQSKLESNRKLLENKMLRCVKAYNSWIGAYNMCVRALNSGTIREASSYNACQYNISVANRNMEKCNNAFREMALNYEQIYGRPNLVQFAQNNGIESFISP